MKNDGVNAIIHAQASVAYTVYETRWIPNSARFIVLGGRPKGTGLIQINELSQGKITLGKEVDKAYPMKAASFGASSGEARRMASGDFGGSVYLWDIEALSKPLWSVSGGHEGIVHSVDGAGGLGSAHGAPEIVTGGQDGAVHVWDPRQAGKPVSSLLAKPGSGKKSPECWAVAWGGVHGPEDRTVVSGYENGDVKMWDLRAGAVTWEQGHSAGITGLSFDVKDSGLNRLMVTGLEGLLNVYELTTKHPKEGYAYVTDTTHSATTVWFARSMPQNPSVFATSEGHGLRLWKYEEPSEKFVEDSKTKERRGVAGTLKNLLTQQIAEQPIGCFDWSMDKAGLCVYGAYDQSIRVGIVTKADKA